MNARGGVVLYTPEILALAVQLADHPLDDAFACRGEAVSRVCGSKVAVGLSLRTDGKVERAGARVSACAIGQASAALFLAGVRGRNAADLAPSLGALEAWLAGASDRPDWPGIAQLAAARGYAARHPAILLPWKAALVALSNPPRGD